MLASLIVVFREALEAGLIVGIVLAATQGVAARLRWISAGLAAGAAGAALLAVFAGALSDAFDGAGQEVFTASVLAVAVVMLGWHVTWMSAHARELAAQMRAVGQDVKLGRRSLAALSIVVGLAVLREGAEVVLFLFGIAAGGGQTAASMAAGGLAGLVLAAGASFALYRGLTAIPLHRLFAVTNWLIIVLAAGMAGQAAAILHAADLIPGWGEQLWNTSFLVDDGGIAGRTLHALAGYSARPCGVQVATWLATFVALATLSRIVGGRRPAGRTARASAAAVMVSTIVLMAAPARAAEPVTVMFKQHRFYPDHLVVPAGQRFKLEVSNTDDTADEFESTDLNREKLVAPGGKAVLTIGPLDAGTYHFFGDFHSDTAQGILEAK